MAEDNQTPLLTFAELVEARSTALSVQQDGTIEQWDMDGGHVLFTPSAEQRDFLSAGPPLILRLADEVDRLNRFSKGLQMHNDTLGTLLGDADEMPARVAALQQQLADAQAQLAARTHVCEQLEENYEALRIEHEATLGRLRGRGALEDARTVAEQERDRAVAELEQARNAAPNTMVEPIAPIG
jgi:hypothetical protein